MNIKQISIALAVIAFILVAGSTYKIADEHFWSCADSDSLRCVNDTYYSGYDRDFLLAATGINKIAFEDHLEVLAGSNLSHYSKADIFLVLGRMNNNKSYIQKAVREYAAALEDTQNCRAKALIYESLASLNYRRKSSFSKAAEQWMLCQNAFRAQTDRELAEGKMPEFRFNISRLPDKPLYVFPKDARFVVIGNSSFTISRRDVIVSQVDRVTRDWLSYQLENEPWNTTNLLIIFSERLTWPKEEQQKDIGWHEGGRILQLRQVGAKHKTAVGTVVVKHGQKWYAPNEQGVFMFEVPYDKVAYPTTKFMAKGIAVITDTHGMNMIAGYAIRDNATVAIGCCDNPGKIAAAKYLAERGIKVICFTDKYLPLILGQRVHVLGSPPVRIGVRGGKGGKIAVVGRQPVKINLSDKIVVQDVDSNKFAISYYKTPAFYFRNLEKMAQGSLNLEFVNITDFNQMDRVISRAENIIAVRVFNRDDYEKVSRWLKEDKNHRAILFHSASYPYGYRILKEFPNQTTFDDINPIPVDS